MTTSAAYCIEHLRTSYVNGKLRQIYELWGRTKDGWVYCGTYMGRPRQSKRTLLAAALDRYIINSYMPHATA
jgi:hypothetical protein